MTYLCWFQKGSYVKIWLDHIEMLVSFHEITLTHSYGELCCDIMKLPPVVLISRWKWFRHKKQYDIIDMKCINLLFHYLGHKAKSPNAINMMQYVVDSPLNLQLDNYYLIHKGEISFHDTMKWLREWLSHVEKWLLHTTQHVPIDSVTRNPLII